jgi:hypothetical protein
VDVFNNADKVCISGQWHDGGTAETIALADSNGNGIPDLFDPYAYNIANIFDKSSSSMVATLASSANYTLQSSDVLGGGSYRRLGFILTDHSFKFSFKEEWLDTDPADLWDTYMPAVMYSGTAVMNQCDLDGNCFYPLMYNMRSNKMWWGAGIIWDNDSYPSYSSCAWEALH